MFADKSVAISSMPADFSSVAASAILLIAIGRLKIEPAAERTTFGFQMSTLSGETIMPDADAAFAVRINVPILPGSCRLQAIIINFFGQAKMSFRVWFLIFTIAMTPDGVTVSEQALNRFSLKITGFIAFCIWSWFFSA